MSDVTISRSNVTKPAPKWYRKLKKMWANTETLVISLLLMAGYAESSFAMLIVKMGTQTLFENLETLLANGDDYVSNSDDVKPKT